MKGKFACRCLFINKLITASHSHQHILQIDREAQPSEKDIAAPPSFAYCSLSIRIKVLSHP